MRLCFFAYRKLGFWNVLQYKKTFCGMDFILFFKVSSAVTDWNFLIGQPNSSVQYCIDVRGVSGGP